MGKGVDNECGVHVPSIVDRWGRALTMSVVFMFPASSYECGVHVPSIVDRWGRALRMSVVFMFPALWTGGEGR